MERLLSVEQAAELLNVSKWTLAVWKIKRKIPFIKMGKRTLFDPHDLKQFVDSCKVPVSK
jgi:excisionase family DNA binding protein